MGYLTWQDSGGYHESTLNGFVEGLRSEGFAAAYVLSSDEELDAVRVVVVADQPSRTRPNARARSSTQTPLRR